MVNVNITLSPKLYDSVKSKTKFSISATFSAVNSYSVLPFEKVNSSRLSLKLAPSVPLLRYLRSSKTLSAS